jgi:hypothetical protein
MKIMAEVEKKTGNGRVVVGSERKGDEEVEELAKEKTEEDKRRGKGRVVVGREGKETRKQKNWGRRRRKRRREESGEWS